MTASVHAFARPADGGRPPLVPAGVDLREDEIFLRLSASIFDSEWAIECTRDERLAGITLRTRALKQIDNAGSLPASDRLLARLADFGDDAAAWIAVKAMALRGWILCDDGRWHHPEIARNVLHIWIGRLESRRISAWGNKGRAKEGNGRSLDSIMGDMDAALDALAAIDPQDAVLSRGSDQQVKWRKRIAEAADPDETPYEGPNRSPIRLPSGGGPKVRQAKRSQEDSSSPQSGDDSPRRENGSEEELGLEGGSAKRTTGAAHRHERAPPWPSGWFETFKALFPRREAWGRAEKVLERIRKAGRVPFEDIMAGVERLVARIEAGELPLRYTPVPAKWLDGRGWEDDPRPSPGTKDPPGRAARPMSGIDSAAYGFDAAFRRPPPGPLIEHDGEPRP